MNTLCGCNCATNPQPDGYQGVTGDIDYNGQATCTGFNSGDLNDFIEHITALICEINQTILDLDIDTDEVGIGSIEPLCLEDFLLTAENLTDVINVLISKICDILNFLSNLEAGDVAIDIDFSCLGVADPTNLYEAIEALRDYLCAYKPDVEFDIPLKPHYIGGYTISDISAMGVPKVRFTLTEYWANQRYIEIAQTDVILGNSSDNYIFIDNTTSDYNVSGVAIGNPAPVVDGDVVAVVRTGIGTVTSITETLTNSPIDGTFIDDGSLDITKLDVAGTFGDSLEVGGGGLMEVATEDSLELDGVTGRVQLVNDEAAPAASHYYGTSAAGAKGFHAMPTADLDGEQVNIAAAAGSITLASGYNVYNITATDGVDIDTAAGIGVTVRRAVIRNATGGDITFATGGTFNLTDDTVLIDGECADILIRSGVIEIVVDFKPLDTILWERGSGALSVQHVNTTTSNDASGVAAVAAGEGCTASGDSAIALGEGCTASANQSVALGKDTVASATGATAMGNTSTATAARATAMGDSDATAVGATAMGTSQATAVSATAMGTSQATEVSATAMGASIASAVGATAMGSSIASAERATAMGFGTIAVLQGCVAHSSDRSSDSNYAQSNSFTLYEDTTDATPTNLLLAGGITLQSNKMYNLKIQGSGSNGVNFVSYEGSALAYYDGANVVIVDDTIAVIHDAITIGGVAAVGEVGGTEIYIQVTGKLATNIRWAAAVTMVEHSYS